MNKTLEEIKAAKVDFEMKLETMINTFARENSVRVNVDVREIVFNAIGERADYVYECLVEVKL